MKQHWDERFLREAYVYGKDANQFIQEITPKILSEGQLLAIAEGEGRNAFYLTKEAQENSRELKIDLWDFSEVAIEKVEARKGLLPIETFEVDLTKVDWKENQYDAAICVYGHFDQAMQKQIFKGLRKTVKDGGWIFGEVYSMEQLPYESGGPRNLDYLYSPQLFLEVFADDFMKHFYLGEVYREEGLLHKGVCHVIQYAIQIRK